MIGPQNQVYPSRRTEECVLADVREAMSRCDGFAPAPEQYASESNFFEVLAAMEALTVEGEVLA